MPRRPQPLLIRIAHWTNVPAFLIMMASGLQIWSAYPFFGPRGATYDWIPLQGFEWPSVLRAGQWLAGARHLHFAFAWLFVLNGLVYVGYLVVSREWRRRFATAALYRRRQRIAYGVAIGLGGLLVWSGFAMWKPVQLHWLGWPLGGYDGARVVHYYATLGLLAFLVGHVVMVALHARKDWRKMAEMITGGRS